MSGNTTLRDPKHEQRRELAQSVVLFVRSCSFALSALGTYLNRVRIFAEFSPQYLRANSSLAATCPACLACGSPVSL